MDRNLLFTLIISLFAFTVSAQLTGDCQGCDTDKYNELEQSSSYTNGVSDMVKRISIYPNPAVNFIGLSDVENVKQIIIFNIMGREEKAFNVEKGMKYDVSDLRTGMYLVQIVGDDNKVITTQRLNKS